MITEHIKAGRLGPALAALQDRIRANGADAQLRLSLVQLLCVMGQWDRARTQLQALDSLGEEFRPWTGMMGRGMLAESLRREVFAGRATPIILGEPPAWTAPLIQAIGVADAAQQAALRTSAFEGARAVSVTINGKPAPWIADADSRLGPVLEAAMDGKYYWIPFERIRRLSIAPPTDLRHLVWIPVQATWVTGGESTLLVPTRYAGTELASDDRLRLARLTSWEEIGAGQFRGVGQRMFAAGDDEYPLLEMRTVELEAV